MKVFHRNFTCLRDLGKCIVEGTSMVSFAGGLSPPKPAAMISQRTLRRALIVIALAALAGGFAASFAESADLGFDPVEGGLAFPLRMQNLAAAPGDPFPLSH